MEQIRDRPVCAPAIHEMKKIKANTSFFTQRYFSKNKSLFSVKTKRKAKNNKES